MTDQLLPGNKHSNAWCPIPFNAVSLHPTGSLTRCMMSEEYMSNREDLDWDNPDFQKLRRDMLAGTWDEEGCINCKMKEDVGAQSQRQNWLVGSQSKKMPPEAYDNPKITGNTIRHLFLNFNNVCNFKCRMCSPRYSNSLIPEHKWITENVNKYHKYEPENSKNINNVEKFLNKHRDNLKEVTSVWITGGEPFIGDTLWQALDILAEYGVPENIRLSVTTNGSRVDLNKMEAFSRFKQLHFDLSMDSVGDLFEYMRSDGIFTWQQFDSFVKELKVYNKSASWMNVSVNSSYQVYNSMDIYNFYEYVHDNFGPDSVNKRVLVGPQQYQARNCPDIVKDEANKQIQRLLDSKLYGDEDNSRSINDCHKMLNREPVEEMERRLRVYTEATDRYRNKFVRDYIPLLAQGLDLT